MAPQGMPKIIAGTHPVRDHRVLPSEALLASGFVSFIAFDAVVDVSSGLGGGARVAAVVSLGNV